MIWCPHAYVLPPRYCELIDSCALYPGIQNNATLICVSFRSASLSLFQEFVYMLNKFQSGVIPYKRLAVHSQPSTDITCGVLPSLPMYLSAYLHHWCSNIASSQVAKIWARLIWLWAFLKVLLCNENRKNLYKDIMHLCCTQELSHILITEKVYAAVSGTSWQKHSSGPNKHVIQLTLLS